MPRHNASPNPSAKTSVSTWLTNRALSREAAIGADRPWAGRITGGGVAGTEYYIIPEPGAAAPGQIWTVTAQLNCSTAQDMRVYWIFANSSNVVLLHGGGSTTFQPPAGSWTRIYRTTTTAPPDTAKVAAQVTLVGGISTLDVTAALYEQTPDERPFFDGDSYLGSWDGADGNSTSTLADLTPIYPISQYGSFH